MTRLRRQLTRTLFGVGRPRPTPRGVRLRCGSLEDRSLPGDVLWTALGAELGAELGSDLASGLRPAEPPAAVAPASRPGVEESPKREAFEPWLGTPRQPVAAPPAPAAGPSTPSAWLPVGVGVAPQGPAGQAGSRPAEKVVAPSFSVAPAPGGGAVVAALAPPPAEPKDAAVRPAGFVGIRPSAAAPAPAVAAAAFDAVAVASTAAEAEPVAEAVAAPAAAAATPAAVKPEGTYYRVGDQVVPLTARPDAVAVRFADAATARAAVASLPAGLSVTRWVTDAAPQIEGPGAADLALPGGTAVPVYSPSDAKDPGRGSVVFDEVVVRLDAGTTPEAAFGSDPRVAGYRPLSGTPDQFVVTAAAGPGAAALRLGNDLHGEPGVAWAEPNFYLDVQRAYTPNDPRFANEWHLKNTGQGGGLAGADSNLPAAWDVNPGGSAAVTIAVVDDGVPIDHPDILNWVNPGEVPGNGLDDDGNGYADDVYGWNFVSNIADATPKDPVPPDTSPDEHGTSVAGVAAARGDNGVGVAGAAYKSAVMSVKIFKGSSATSDANIASALYYAAGRTANGLGTWKAADVVNNSWGGGSASAAINAALTWGTTQGRQGKGATYFFASGNEFSSVVGQPAAQSAAIPGVIAVGAVTNLGGRSTYSNYGTALDLVTPSSGTGYGGTLNIDTTDRVGAAGYDPSDYTGTGGNGFGGTSSATPLAAGIGALVLAQADAKGVTLTPTQLRGLLRNSTDLVGGATYDPATGKNLEYGAGRLNAFTAVSGVGKPEVSVTSSTADVANGADAAVGPVKIGQPVIFRVRNQGTSALSLAGLALGGDASFTLVSGFSATTLAVGDAATFAVAFAPAAAGTYDGTVSFTSNDADEGAFGFTVRGTVAPVSAYGRVYEDWNGDGSRGANDPAVAGQTVYLDANANGVFDSTPTAQSFTQSTSVAIPDPGTVTSSLAVSGFTNPVTDVNVTVNITHTYDSDLDLILISPAGTRVTLFSAVGGKGDNFTNTVLDDQAGTAIGSGTAPFTGSYRPASPLSAVNGQAGDGTWKLEVTDAVAVDSGVLVSWKLTVASTTSEPYAVTDAYGYYAFAGLADGPYTARTVTPAGWAATAGAAGRTFTVSGASLAANQDFGQAKNDRFYGYVWNDQNGNGVVDAGEPPVAGRMLYRDLNGNGVYDPGTPGSFTQTNSTPLAIPDNGTATSSMSVAGASGIVVGVNVTVNITHTWDGDLVGTLIAPNGTRVTLMNRDGGSGANFTNTVFDDTGTTAIGSGTAPFTGTYKPTTLIAAVNGSAPNGVWKLEVSDNATRDTGTLNSWSITVSTLANAEPTTSTNALGDAFFDLPAGNHDIRLAPQAGYAFTSPATGLISVTAAGTPLTNKNFGTALIPAVAGAAVVNGGSAQHSMVTSLAVTFNGPVTFAAGAFTLTRVGLAGGGAGDNLVVTPTVSTALVGGQTVATLTFPAGAPDYGSLADGRYTLKVDRTLVTSAAGLQPAADYTQAGVFRLFGDADGSGAVDAADLRAFRGSFGAAAGDTAYRVEFDVDASNAVDAADLRAFRGRFGQFV